MAVPESGPLYWHCNCHYIATVSTTWWRHQMETFPRCWPFVRGIHRSPVNSPHKGQWPRALMFSLICVWINGWINNREAGDLRRHRTHCDVIVMGILFSWNSNDKSLPLWKFVFVKQLAQQKMAIQCIDTAAPIYLRDRWKHCLVWIEFPS